MRTMLDRLPGPIGFFFRRLLIGVGLLVAVAVLTFVMIQSVPGDPARLLLSGDSGGGSEEAVEALRAELGLDRPLAVQFLAFLGGMFTGDLGTSFVHRQPVMDLIASRLPNTLEIVGAAAVLSALAGVAIGLLSAIVSRDRRGGTVFSTFTSLGLSAPVYVTGTLLVYFVSVKLHLLPAGGFASWSQDPGRHVQLLVLPVLTIAIGLICILARATRSSVLETRGQDWVRTAKALGHSPVRLWLQAVLRNSLTPVVTLIGLEIGVLVGSTVLVEQVFNWPGLSSLLIESVAHRDYPVIQGVILVTSAIFIVINIIVDYLYGVLDPRARSGS
ncbi:ABC transporter permease [Brevibacterium album]|uniref:ABC transporter permease n=1 Tax=Brevibacterium album TaxID=417948 RepID=UPI00068865FD|nr:ABC transporter permease [Brevibacterium album]